MHSGQLRVAVDTYRPTVDDQIRKCGVITVVTHKENIQLVWDCCWNRTRLWWGEAAALPTALRACFWLHSQCYDNYMWSSWRSSSNGIVSACVSVYFIWNFCWRVLCNWRPEWRYLISLSAGCVSNVCHVDVLSFWSWWVCDPRCSVLTYASQRIITFNWWTCVTILSVWHSV